MQGDNRLFDDLARMASGAVSALNGVREDAESRIREEFRKRVADWEFVTREEFEAVQAMAQAAREENERLGARLTELERRLAAQDAGKAQG